jgi:hypothetical protein
MKVKKDGPQSRRSQKADNPLVCRFSKQLYFERDIDKYSGYCLLYAVNNCLQRALLTKENIFKRSELMKIQWKNGKEKYIAAKGELGTKNGWYPINVLQEELLNIHNIMVKRCKLKSVNVNGWLDFILTNDCCVLLQLGTTCHSIAVVGGIVLDNLLSDKLTFDEYCSSKHFKSITKAYLKNKVASDNLFVSFIYRVYTLITPATV